MVTASSFEKIVVVSESHEIETAEVRSKGGQSGSPDHPKKMLEQKYKSKANEVLKVRRRGSVKRETLQLVKGVLRGQVI